MDSTFTAVTFNILARSLGSSVIPWVLNVSNRARDIVGTSRDVPSDFDIKRWLRGTAEVEYKEHFHRNFASGDKESMRSMWSACVERQDEVPAVLKFVECVEADRLRYPGKRDDKATATTLRGLLRRDIPDVADELFAELTKDEHIFRWETRGPRIFETATCSAVSEFFPGESSTKLSDIVTLCEVRKSCTSSSSALTLTPVLCSTTYTTARFCTMA
jgi:hypothetical protein